MAPDADRHEQGRFSVSRVVIGALVVAAALANLVAAGLLGAVAPYLPFGQLARGALIGLGLASAAGMASWWRPRSPAPAYVLLLASAAWAGPGLSIGVAQATWLWIPLGGLIAYLAPPLTWVAHAFPTSRVVGGRSAHLVVAAILFVASAAFAVRVFLYDPAVWGWCQCAANPFALTVEPETYLTMSRWVSSALSLAMVVSAIVFLMRRGLHRHLLSGAMAAAVGALSVAWVFDDPLAPSSPHLGAGWARSLDATVVTIVGTYLIALHDQRPSRAHVADLLLAAQHGERPSAVQGLVARALGDREARVVWWRDDTQDYRDLRGVVSEEDQIPPGEVGLAVHDTLGRPIALVVYDGQLDVPDGVTGSVAQALRLIAENDRLARAVQKSLEEVRESRRRIVTASDEARRQIERDLHDGAQQQLISVGMTLRTASARARDCVDPTLAAQLARATSQLNTALSELRELANGITPTALVHGGIESA